MSVKIREIFYRYTNQVEPLSLDEAYLDVTEDKQGIGSALEIAAQIKKAINEELSLTASAGISINKFVAKIASAMKKPDGLTFIGPSKIEAFMNQLPVEKFFGVGKVTATKMKAMGLHTGADIKNITERDLVKNFGKSGHFFYNIVRGIDERLVESNRETKSIGVEDTFSYDLNELEEMTKELEKLTIKVAERLQRYGLKGRTITIKIKYSDFKIITRSQSFVQPVNDADTIGVTARQLLLQTEPEGTNIRLLGITLSNFGEIALKPKNDDSRGQLQLF